MGRETDGHGPSIACMLLIKHYLLWFKDIGC
jgi:hypothetical protein